MVGFLTARDKVRLRHLTEEIERDTGAEIAALVVRHAADVAGFARAYFDHVGIGKRDHDNGVLVLVALDDRRIHIEVGRGLASIIPAADAQRIIDFVMVPQFRRARYGDGLVHGVEALGHLLRRPPAGERPSSREAAR